MVLVVTSCSSARRQSPAAVPGSHLSERSSHWNPQGAALHVSDPTPVTCSNLLFLHLGPKQQLTCCSSSWCTKDWCWCYTFRCLSETCAAFHQHINSLETRLSRVAFSQHHGDQHYRPVVLTHSDWRKNLLGLNRIITFRYNICCHYNKVNAHKLSMCSVQQLLCTAISYRAELSSSVFMSHCCLLEPLHLCSFLLLLFHKLKNGQKRNCNLHLSAFLDSQNRNLSKKWCCLSKQSFKAKMKQIPNWESSDQWQCPQTKSLCHEFALSEQWLWSLQTQSLSVGISASLHICLTADGSLTWCALRLVFLCFIHPFFIFFLFLFHYLFLSLFMHAVTLFTFYRQTCWAAPKDS